MEKTLSSFFRKDRISTGIKELDIALEGGYQNPGAIIILSSTIQEKLAFALHFTQAGINRGEKVAYIAFDLSPDEIEKKADAFGMDFKTHVGKELIFIDAYSHTIRVKPADRNKDISIPGPGAFNDLSLALNDIIRQSEEADGTKGIEESKGILGTERTEGKRIRVIFHSLSTLSLYSQLDVITKFLHVIQGKLKTANATSLWLLDEGACDKKFISILESISDQKLVISDKGGAYELNVTNIPIPLSMKIGAAGIEIL
ncbi:MAG: ATPase domain-containing protein [Candidatus Micrarchaeota archaeon]